MRLKIKLSSSNYNIPINNQYIVNNFFHRLLGKNNKYHDTYSNYCVSNLIGGKLIDDNKTHVSFNDGGYIVISSYDIELMSQILIGLAEHNKFYKDIKVNGFEYLPPEKFYNGWNYFRTLTPILLKIKGQFITIDDDNFVDELIAQTKRKLLKINSNLDLSKFNIIINKHPSHKIKKVLVRNVINKASQIHLNIFCDKKVADILYNVGVGNSTGSGFGMIYNVKNNNLYY